MKLSEWAKKNGIGYQTAWRLFKGGKLPANVKATQLETGTVLVEEVGKFCPHCGKEIGL